MVAWKSLMHSGLVLLGMLLCWGLSSCSPWERDLDRVYQVAQKGDKNAMYAVVMNYEEFQAIVPMDSFKLYQRKLIESGNNAVITDAWLAEWAAYEKAHPNMDAGERSDKLHAIAAKWHRIGIEYNDAESYYNLGDHYSLLYHKTHNPQDSIKASECFQKAWENWHQGERIRRDREAGIIPLVKGGIAYGWHVYQTTAHESFIPRLFNAGMFFSEYIMSGLLKLLFTSQWWKVLLAILVLTIVMSVPMLIVNRLYMRHSAQRISMHWGMRLGFWNLLLMFVAYCNDNPNWVSNVGALWFPEASYGIQPYLCVIPNLLLWLLLFIGMVFEVWDYVEHGKGFVKGLLSAAGIGIIFTVSYLMAGVVGLFYLFIVIVVILAKLLLKSIPEAAGIAVGAAFPTTEELVSKEKACTLCSHYGHSSEFCPLVGEKRERYDGAAYSCPYYTTDK